MLYHVGQVMIAFGLQDNHKFSLALSLYNKRDMLFKCCNITEKLSRSDEKICYFQNLTVKGYIVTKSQAGSVYK